MQMWRLQFSFHIVLKARIFNCFQLINFHAKILQLQWPSFYICVGLDSCNDAWITHLYLKLTLVHKNQIRYSKLLLKAKKAIFHEEHSSEGHLKTTLFICQCVKSLWWLSFNTTTGIQISVVVSVNYYIGWRSVCNLAQCCYSPWNKYCTEGNLNNS